MDAKDKESAERRTQLGTTVPPEEGGAKNPRLNDSVLSNGSRALPISDEARRSDSGESRSAQGFAHVKMKMVADIETREKRSGSTDRAMASTLPKPHEGLWIGQNAAVGSSVTVLRCNICGAEFRENDAKGAEAHLRDKHPELVKPRCRLCDAVLSDDAEETIVSHLCEKHPDELLKLLESADGAK